MQQFFRFLANNPGLVITLFVVGAPILSAIFRALSEQKKKRDYLEAKRRAELEALRTGRPTEGTLPEPSARQRLEELAQKRRQTMARGAGVEVQQAPAPQTPPPVPGGVRQVRLPGGIILEIPEELTQAPPQPPRQAPARARGPQQRPPGRPQPGGRATGTPQRQPSRPSRPAPSPGHQPVPQSRQPMAPTRPPAPARREPEPEPATQRAAALAAAMETPAPTPPTPAPRRTSILFPLTTADWKRAVVLREVLGPPMAMRE